jgi:hypothetical protein
MATKSKSYIWKDPRGYAKAAIIALWAQIGISAVYAAVLLAPGAAGYFAVSPPNSGIVLVLGLIDALSVIAFVGGLITAGMWVYRVNANAHVLRPGMTHGPWGCIFWYLVPIANLIVPYEALAETWDVSVGKGRTRSGRGIVLVWWLIFLGVNIVSAISAFAVGAAGGSQALLILAVLVSLASIVPALLYLMIVQRLTRNQLATFGAHVFSDEPVGGDSVLARATG